ncbi:hypothetical protein K440DRAFT_658465 [Wilcoxina mikolae CBS 423.85]|nr:hypothetical protein K440DRAFT_658465 [Wilcoxina mikolae CBS 423.85]
MKLSLVSTAIFVALSSAATLPRGLPLTSQYFKLKVADDAPKEVAGQYINVLVGKGGAGSLGIYPNGEEFQGYISGTSPMKGAIISAKDEKAKVFLDPTHGNPVDFVRLGNPFDEKLALWKDFTVSQSASKGPEKATYWLDYPGLPGSASKNWIACSGGKDEWTLEFIGPPGQASCTEAFQLQVVYVVAK